MRKIELPIKEIVEKYENGTSSTDLAIEYGISIFTMNARIKEYYEKSGIKRPVFNGGKKKIELPIEEIVEKYENGTSSTDLAIEYGISIFTMNARIKEYYENRGIKRPVFSRGTKKIELPIKQIVERFEKGASITDLAIEYGTSYDTMNNRINEYYRNRGIERPIIKRKNKSVIELPIEEIIEKYENKISITDLAIEYGTSYATINTRIKEYYEKSEDKILTIKVGRKKIELPIEEIIQKCENGTSIKDLAIEYGTSSVTINTRIKEYYENRGIKRPVFYNGGRKKTELPIKQIVERYERGTRITDLAIEYETSDVTINTRIKEYYENRGIKRPVFSRGKNKTELPIEEIVEKYENGTSSTDLAIEYEISYDIINNRLNEYYRNRGIERPVFSKRRKELPIEEIVEKYKNGTSITDLAIEYETFYWNINNRIREYYEKNAKEELSIDEIVQKYENGLSKSRIAREFGVLVPTITYIIKEYYEKSGDETPTIKVERKKVELPIDEIIQKYENGTSIKDLAIEYSVADCTIKGKIEGYYKSKGKKVPRILKSLTVIEEYFKKGMSIEEIVEIASNRNIIIPKELIDTALNDKNIVDEER